MEGTHRVKYRLLEWLACPECRGSDLALETRGIRNAETYHGAWEDGETELPGLDFEGRTVTDIHEGLLSCRDCSAVYPIVDGIPRMLPEGFEEGPASGHRWTEFQGEAPEYESNFRDMTAPLSAPDYLGRLVMDAGCGFGRHAFYAARYGADVLALDHSADAVASAKKNCAALPRVHVVQGDLRRPPFRDEICDMVFCFGVLHHTEDPRTCFERLRTCLQPGGRLQVWVYGPRQGSVAVASSSLHGAAAAMTDETLHQASRWLARGLRVFSHTPYRLLKGTPGLHTLVTHLPAHDHHKWPFDVVVADVYDRLRIPVRAYITGEELERWFGDGAYADIQVTRRVRNNESFRGMGTRR